MSFRAHPHFEKDHALHTRNTGGGNAKDNGKQPRETALQFLCGSCISQPPPPLAYRAHWRVCTQHILRVEYEPGWLLEWVLVPNIFRFCADKGPTKWSTTRNNRNNNIPRMYHPRRPRQHFLAHIIPELRQLRVVATAVK